MSRPNNPCPECGHTHQGAALAYICIGCPCPVVGPWEEDEADEIEYVCIERWGSEAHGGPGWYYYWEEYPDEGSCGPYETWEEAEEHAKANDGVARPRPTGPT